ncbi:DUF4041 domain-containing protein [Flavobacterium sp. C4GT6]|uniref:DUF4041 domain-containing protein n=1 Tax=Flavobacterium sp. C4GT6 TaxID=3103818 RepID=UPI002ED3D575
MGFFDFLKKKELEQIKTLQTTIERYKPLLNIEEEVIKKENEFKDQIVEKEKELNLLINQKQERINSLESEYSDLKSNYQSSKEVYSRLRKDINLYENKMDFIEYGVYEPVYDFEKSDDYREELNNIKNKQKQMIQSETAATCSVNWTIDGSFSKGKSSTKRLIKLVLRAFNGESDSLIAKVKWNNINQIKERIRKSFESINKLGEGNAISISHKYFELKIDELTLEYEYQAKRQEEKEKMRALQEELREEEKAKREFEKAQKEAAKKEADFQKALEKVQKELGLADLESQEKLKKQIETLEAQLEEARLKKERALSMAQQTKRGHVYIISNIGSFGENIYKIGMTRRLEPSDRVRELGDASVPFQFDIHAMIYSDEARTLEYELHQAFAEKKVNMLNYRREFFNATLEEIESKIKELGFKAEFSTIPEAMEYRETQVILNKIKNQETIKTVDELINEEYPSEL